MSCLKEIAKRDETWRRFALSICGCKHNADDLVQEMYIKIRRYENPNEYMVYVIIRNAFYNQQRDKKTVCKEEFPQLQCNGRQYYPDDAEMEILDRYNDLPWVQQELIAENYEKSLRQIEETFPLINYAYAHRELKKARQHVLGNKFQNSYNNSRRKR